RWHWQILRTDSRNLTFFNQLLSEDGTKRGELDDRPFAPNSWPAGTTGVSWFEIPIDTNAQTGPLSLIVGAYERTTMERLPVVDHQGRSAGDQLTLGPIKVNGHPVPPPNVAVR